MSDRVCAVRSTIVVLAFLLVAAPHSAAGQGAGAAPPADPDPARFAADFDAFAEYDRKSSEPEDAVLFVGSSSIRLWPTAERFPELAVLNRGFGGSHISDLNHYLDVAVLKYRPAVVVVYAGDNDVQAGKSPARVVAGYQEFAGRVLAARGDTDIIYIPIKPSLARWDKWPLMQEVNRAVKEMGDSNPRLHYADVVLGMLGSDGRPRPELFVDDGLHMTPAGYDVWTEVVGRAIETVLGQREVVFFDDFSEPEIDRSKWNVIVTGRTVNNEQQAYVDSPETIRFVTGEAAQGAANGALAITARSRPGFTTPEGRRFDFISGRLDTRDKVEFTYGTASARLKLTAGSGLWPAFWVLGGGRWPDTGEMDIMENVGDPSWTNVALHGPGYSGDTPLVMRNPLSADDNATEWHVYSMDWSPTGFVFKVDDVPFYAVTKRMVEAHGPWAYDNPKHLIVNLALGGAYPRAVNQVDTPYVGLPAETVELIRADRAVMLVDWVRVTSD